VPPVSDSETVIKTLKAKYRIARNVFALCRLDVLEATDQQMKLLVGVLKKGDRQLTVGTQLILLNPGSMEFMATHIKSVEEANVYLCNPLKIDPIEERRQEARRDTDFTVYLGEQPLKAINGSYLGLTLQTEGAQSTLTNLAVDRVYALKVTYKQVEYVLDGVLRHLHYDWKTYHHTLGVHFPGLNQEQETVLRFLVDPNYTVPVAESQRVDTATGKISL
jgi:hypothetical protein